MSETLPGSADIEPDDLKAARVPVPPQAIAPALAQPRSKRSSAERF